MIKNYLKVAFRNLVKNKFSSLINIGGLAIGMAVAILIGIWIYDELSFDKHFKNYGRIGRVIQNVTNNNEVQTWTNVPVPLAEELRLNYGADFKRVVMGTSINDHLVVVGDKKLIKKGVYFEAGAPEMFSLQLIAGTAASFNDPKSVFISASAAKAYFGDEDPLNKILRIDNVQLPKITGVYKDFPANSSFADLDFIAPWALLYNNTDWIKNMDDPWRPNAFTLYVQLNENADFQIASARIKDAKLKKVNPQLAKKKPALFLHPMSDWHLYSEFKNGVNVGGAISYVWMFGIIGIFVVILACINFMNISTARSEKRAKEVGIRKAVGSLRQQLVGQFFSESLLTAFFAFVLSMLVVQLILPFFNNVAGKQLSILWQNPVFWICCIGFTFITGLIAGTYPAFYLSSFRPIKVLKGTFKAGRLAAIPRKVLVVIQFTVSVALIIGTIIVFQQIQYAKSRPVGYNRQGLISVPMSTPIHEHFNVVSEELKRSGLITDMGESGSPTTAIWSSTSGISWPGKDPNLSIDFGNIDISYDYGKTIGWEFKSGRDFSRDFATDSAAVILNEAAANFMTLKQPIGETITWWDQSYKVIGIVKNMVMQSPYEPARPTVFNLSREQGNVSIIRINPSARIDKALSGIGSVFTKFSPDQPFEFKFVDDDYAAKFENEERIGKLATFFAILAIFISCLGLFGMSSFVAEQRTKELGVRKVLGASVFNLWRLLSKDFIWLVAISLGISTPVAYYFMNKWIQQFEYRTGIEWWTFVLAGLGAILITILTVSFQSIKAALANPVKSLRTE